ncbi:MAG: hypothetical protein ABW198_04830 [Pseudorhodoplanes sp.]
MPVSIGDIARQMVVLLPQDGAPVLNRVMRVMLARRLETTIDQDHYFEARDLLLRQGRVGIQRGQGGQVFLLPEKASQAAPPKASEVPAPVGWTEAQLMKPLKAYLHGPFAKGLDLPKEAACVVQDTSAIGPRRGRWARPDFILVSAMKFNLMPGAQVDVHSFELKAESGATDLAVYEALAQTRFTHFGHLVWHLPEQSESEARLAEIAQQCDQHGIGLIRMFDPDNAEACEILVDPVRKATLPAIVDGFLERRLSGDQRNKIAHAINGARA